MFLVAACITFSCEFSEKSSASEIAVSEKNKEAILLAKQYCAACHEYVSPDKLPTKYWEVVLSKMSRYMGFDTKRRFYGNTQVAIDRLDSAKVFPSEQIISKEDWLKIVVFYLDHSPENLDISNRPVIDFDMKQFEVKTIPWKTELKGPTFIQMLENKNIAVGFSQVKDVNEFKIINLEGSVLQSKKIPSALASVSQVGNEMYMAFMGAFAADDTPTGSIGKVEVDSNYEFTAPLENVLAKKERPVVVKALDVNGDHKVDIIASEFGKFLGGLNLYLQNESGGYEKTTLFSGPGANSIVIRDINNDGLPDFYALISQGTEGVHLFLNQGSGKFESKKVINLPPYYGSVFIDLVDFDQDGLEDILLTNGDSGDFGNPEKSFHGIRCFKNKGNQIFEEEWFYPQQGAYKSIALDFDQDGDLDIASIGFFAHGTSLAQESFLYLENTGVKKKQVQFKTFSFTDASQSSYLVMDAGDIDGDGDQDLILGASTSLMTNQEIAGKLIEWQSKGGAVVILENKLK
ncbi:FG-GAP repeat domain-containing protein [Portibacter lacus]|uniref:VCBS repeat-containing protein n=1 Tax=Portibacter lacus TaxID=1099794 RepID=A0AA37SRI4_9BACT|nr:VCBS repeat-containing protein [Portibacter lacus]GLR17481.1 hypothetical protein GCM10007940_20960 [Portibacter lacus]